MNKQPIPECRGEPFSLGGSSILMVLKPGTVTVDSDITEHSLKQIETKVRLGEKVAEKVQAQAS